MKQPKSTAKTFQKEQNSENETESKDAVYSFKEDMVSGASDYTSIKKIIDQDEINVLAEGEAVETKQS